MKSRLAPVAAVFALSFLLPFTAGATVRKEGAWPSPDKTIDLSFDGKPSDGLKKLAKEAGWSLVVTNTVAVDAQGADVHVDVDDQPAEAVLEALFVGRDVVASRTGSLVTIIPSPSPLAPPAPVISPTPLPTLTAVPSPPSVTAPPVPTVRGEDRSVVGGKLVIHKDEIVHSVTVAGGTLRVEGTITGDLVVAGGSAKIMNGGRVIGNASVFGGSLRVENNGRVDGDFVVAGGSLQRDEGAIVGGHVVGDKRHPRKLHLGAEERDDEPRTTRSRISEAAHAFGQSLTKMALLFVLGCVFLALLAPRMEKVRVEIAARPMRSFALGLVGMLFGSVGALIVLAVLCVTVIGIPIAFFAIVLGCLAVYGAIASVLTTFGAAVIGHRTENVYLHLLLGCAAFLVLSSIPWVGGVVIFAVTMTAVGALITTRIGGLLDRDGKRRSMGLV